MTIEALRQAAENPNLPEADREAARKELERLEADAKGESGVRRHKLEPELLQAACCVRLEGITYGQVHRFCSDRNWSDEAKSLYFEHWLPAYLSRNDWGRQQLSTTADYLPRDGPCPDELRQRIDAWRVLREVRRRFKADPSFAALFTPAQVAELGLGKDDYAIAA